MFANNKNQVHRQSLVVKVLIYTLVGLVAWRYRNLFGNHSTKTTHSSMPFIGWI
jgi:hypothetical protein